MRIHLLEHDADDLSDTYLIRWAKQKGFEISQTYVCKNEKLPLLSSFDWLMVMGGSLSVYEENRFPWLLPEKQLIAEVLAQNKMILGICFGAQLMAEALGGTVSENSNKEIGWHEVVLTDEGQHSCLFKNVPGRFDTFHWHSDYFSMPPGCIRLAESVVTQNQAFAVKNKSAVGLQFHPEYTRGMVTYFSSVYGNQWGEGPFITPPGTVLEQTRQRPSAYRLMSVILDNMLEMESFNSIVV